MEVLSYANRFVLVAGEEEWANSHFQSLTEPVTLVVEGVLSLHADVSEETLADKVEIIDLFGEIRLAKYGTKGALMDKICVNEGHIAIVEEGQEADKQPPESHNVGELSL